MRQGNSELKYCEFAVVTVNDKGQEIKREKKRAEYYLENLGNGVGIEMVSIPGSSFMMGSPQEELNSYDFEKPEHPVTVPSFFMGRYLITQAQWRIVAGWEQVEQELRSDPSYVKRDYKGIDRWTRPVELISWEEAQEFCRRLSKKTKREYRLPTEAEWEYACRAETTSPFHFGETMSTELANYDGKYIYSKGAKGKSRNQTTPVGYFKVANAFGLYDMHGNLWEWCQDDWHDNYDGAPNDGSAWLSAETNSKVRRGGCWLDYPNCCRSAFREFYTGKFYDCVIGFRVVCVVGSFLPEGINPDT